MCVGQPGLDGYVEEGVLRRRKKEEREGTLAGGGSIYAPGRLATTSLARHEKALLVPDWEGDCIHCIHLPGCLVRPSLKSQFTHCTNVMLRESCFFGRGSSNSLTQRCLRLARSYVKARE